MSKVDAMRALREARYAAAAKGGAGVARPTPAAGPAAASAKPTVRRKPVVEPAATPQSDALCGHRNMGGRSCTREVDHVKNGTKNHRYG